MTPSAYGDIVACLPQGRTVFRYGHGQFAPMLVRQLLLRGWTARAIRNSSYAKLLERESMRQLLASSGNLNLTPDDPYLAFPDKALSWRLTISQWQDNKNRIWNQMSRRGCNLVLQLNFCSQHDAEFAKLFGTGNGWLLRNDGHPMSKTENTIAWARLDIDLDEGAVLIEEIQSDWVRNAERIAKRPNSGWYRLQRARTSISGVTSAADLGSRAKTYFADVMPAYAGHWQETIMAACQFFAFEELGVERLYMHTFETGNLLKGIDPKWSAPPKSIYTDLPRRMGFTLDSRGPEFLQGQLQARKVRKDAKRHPTFWLLSLERPDGTAASFHVSERHMPCHI